VLDQPKKNPKVT